MGKGFKNYISRWFHPTNVEQKSAGEKKRQQELRDQYERVFSNKELMGDEKSRLGLAFMYNTPAGYKELYKKVEKEEPKLELPPEQNITIDLTFDRLDNLRDLSRRDKKYFLKRLERLKRKGLIPQMAH